MPGREQALDLCARRMEADGAQPLAIEAFRKNFLRMAGVESGLIPRTTIEPIHAIADYKAAAGRGEEALQKCVLIKLNGGLGTSMGLETAKSLIPAKAGLSFLDIIVRQVLVMRKRLNGPLPLLFMNSFITHEDTLAALKAYPELQEGPGTLPACFVQNRIPKIRQDTLEPVVWPENPSLEWCPPGHGDLYTALVTAGILDALLSAGFEYAFVSNSDNLGATLDHRILGYFSDNSLPFMMEVTDRTDADKKGGHLARSRKGHLVLREYAQCPEEELSEFQDISKHRYFNTNNLWLNLKALARMLAKSGNLPELPLIVNRKTVDPNNPESCPVYQLETAMGAAIALFPGAGALRVPRSRFAPVKTTNDLLVLWSDAYRLTPDMLLDANPAGRPAPPVVDLDRAFYRRVQDLRNHFPEGAPSLVGCDSVAIRGEVFFGKGVIVKGRATLINQTSRPAHIPDGARIGEGTHPLVPE